MPTEPSTFLVAGSVLGFVLSLVMLLAVLFDHRTMLATRLGRRSWVLTATLLGIGSGMNFAEVLMFDGGRLAFFSSGIGMMNYASSLIILAWHWLNSGNRQAHT